MRNQKRHVMRTGASRPELARTVETLRRMMTTGAEGSIRGASLGIQGAMAGPRAAEGAVGRGPGGQRAAGAGEGGTRGVHQGAEGARGAGPDQGEGAGGRPLLGGAALRRHLDQTTCEIQEL